MTWEWTDRRRKQLREVGSIVLGVLIALGIGEIADTIRWKVRVANSMATIRTELSGNRFNITERKLVQPCIERRLAAIAAILDAARTTGRLPAVGSIDMPPLRPIERTAFDVAQGEGVTMHMGYGMARDVALAYLTVADSYAAETEPEREAWAALMLIEGSGGAIDENTMLALRQALTAARWRATIVAALIERAEGRLAVLDIPIEYGPLRNSDGLAALWKHRALCKPLRVGPQTA